jgi:hypothetical protein
MVKALRLRGEVYRVRGELVAAEAEYDRALVIARKIGNPPQLWKTLVAIGDVRQDQDHLADALEAYGEALAVVEQVAAHLPDVHLRETFLASPHVQHIRQRANSVAPSGSPRG